MNPKILTKEQLAYKLNMNPKLYESKQELLKWWRFRQPIIIRGTERKSGWSSFRELFSRLFKNPKR